VSTEDSAWAPDACTLPTVDRPTRVAEFDDLFRTALHVQERPAPTLLRWHLDPAAEPVARDLAARESECCAFFTFTFSRAAGALVLDIEVPSAHVDVLTALASRAGDRGGS
jgi:hypothetical protein